MKINRKQLRQIIQEAYVDYRDDSPLEPATARLLANVFVIGFENHPDGGFLKPGDRGEALAEVSYYMSKNPAVARKLFKTFEEMRLDSAQAEDELGYDPRAYPEAGGQSEED